MTARHTNKFARRFVRSQISGALALACVYFAATIAHAVNVNFTYTQVDASTGSGTITGNIDTSGVGGPGFLPFSGSLPLPSINQKDPNTNGVTLPPGIIGFFTQQGGPAPGTPNGVHLGWTGVVTLTAESGNKLFLIDVPLTLPTSGESFSYSFDVFDDNSGAGGSNDAAGGTARFAGYIGDDGSGHRHTDSTFTFVTGPDNFTPSAAFNLGPDGQGDALGITATVRDGTLFPGSTAAIFFNNLTFNGVLVADDNTLTSIIIPEPSSAVLISAVLCGAAAIRRRRRNPS